MTDREEVQRIHDVAVERISFINGSNSMSEPWSNEQTYRWRLSCANWQSLRETNLNPFAVRDMAAAYLNQWRPIETAPKDGTEIIVYHPDGGVCAAFCPKDGFAWHCMDGSNTVVGSKSGVPIPAMTTFTSPPTHWMPLPSPPTATVESEEPSVKEES